MSTPDFYGAEVPIIERLKAKLVDGASPPQPLCKIMSAATLGGSTDLAGLCPVIFVAPGAADPVGDSVSDDGDGPEEQNWQVALMLKAIPDHKNYSVTTADLDPHGLLQQAKAALKGFKPFGTGATLVYAGRPQPDLGGDPLGPFPGMARFFINFKLTALP